MIIELLIITTSVVFNALADKYYPWRVEKWPNWTWQQWRWHVFKWLHFHPALAYVLFSSGLHWAWMLGIAVASFFLWRFVYD